MMAMNACEVIQELKKHRCFPFIYVPCSFLAPLIKAAEQEDFFEVLNPVNESIAVGLAAGAHFAGKTPIVAIQNSGFLNTLNPLTSLHQLYKIPMLMFVSWRGNPEHKDAEEHKIVGEDICQYLKVFKVKHGVLKEKSFKEDLKEALNYIREKQLPFVFLVKKGFFEIFDSPKQIKKKYELSSFESIKVIKDIFKQKDTAFICTTGAISRFSYAVKPTKDFYMVGSMGMAVPMGLGLARYTDKKVVILDGDGAFLMHLGAMLNVNDHQFDHLMHVVLDNEAYFSTGNQPTLAGKVDIANLARLLGYAWVYTVKTKSRLGEVLREIPDKKGAKLVHIKVDDRHMKLPKRVTDDWNCVQIKQQMMQVLRTR